MSMPEEKKLNLAFCFAWICLVFSGAFSHFSLNRSIDSAALVIHTGRVLNTIDSLISGIEEYDTIQKGYLITSKPELLTYIPDLLKKIETNISNLEKLVSDNRAQEQRARYLRQLVKQKLDLTLEAKRLHDESNHVELQTLLSENSSAQNMLAIRSMGRTLSLEEDRLQQQRTALNEQSNKTTGWLIIFGTLCASLIVGASRSMIFRDLHKRQLSETALKVSEERLSMVAKATQDIVWDWNLTTNGLWWNDRISSALGYPASEVGKDGDWWVEHIHPDDRDGVSHSIHEALEDPQQSLWSGEYRFRTFDGRYLEMFDRGFLIRNEEGKAVRMIGSMLDISARKDLERDLVKAREAAIESSRLKSEFLANMSHEIRTPMNGVIGMTGLLFDTELTPLQKDYAETIRHCSDSLLIVINDILDFSKIEAGKLEIENSDFELRLVIESCVEVLAAEAHKKGLELLVSIDQSLPDFLKGDSGRIRQILTNLVGNAIKFTHKGEVLVQVKRQDEANRDSTLRIEVIDTGIGIADVHLTKLFQAFVQADGSTARKYGGSGLGLAISRQLVTLMGGELGVTSQELVGSTFWFTLPLVQAADRKPLIVGQMSDLKNLRCLVVDDNVTNQRIVHHQVLSWGMRNGSPSSPQIAIENLQAAARAGDPYDLAILDMHMPGMDGLELTQKIKADPTIAGTRIIIMSSLSQVLSAKETLAAGIAATLTKPVRQSHLFNCLLEVMSDQSKSAPRLPASSPSAQVQVPRQYARVLIAEDNAINQRIALAQMDKLGYRADAVANGFEVLEALSRIRYDVVLMDCQMPEMDGYKATQEIREREKTTHEHLIIIAMTANAVEGDREKCLAAGMDDYIGKPVTMKGLQRVLEIWAPRSKRTA